MNIPNFTQVAKAIEAACADFYAEDQYLLDNDVNERTISHRFARHLHLRFSGWNVDCEYNRHVERVKTLQLPKNGISWEDTEAKTVFPDIIVHKRGEGPNLLVIEMKKTGLPVEFDRQKLRAYKSQMNYEHACLICISVKIENPRFEKPEWVHE